MFQLIVLGVGEGAHNSMSLPLSLALTYICGKVGLFWHVCKGVDDE